MLNARNSSEGGAALIEFALVLPLLVLLLLGSVDMGFYLNDTTKLRTAVREAGRRASTGGYGNTQCPSGAGQANAATYTTPARAGETSKLLCLAKLFSLESGLDAHIATRTVSFDSSGTVLVGQDQPFNSGNGLLLCAQMLSHSRTGILAPLLNSRVVKSSVAMRIVLPGTGAIPNGPGEAAETALSPDWSSCQI